MRHKWWGEDSNLRRLCQQIYSLPRLTASVPHQTDPRIAKLEHPLELSGPPPKCGKEPTLDSLGSAFSNQALKGNYGL